MTRSTGQHVAAGLVAGYLGSRAMDRATAWYWSRMSEQARRAEGEANPEGTMLTVGRPVAARLGRGADPQAAQVTAAQLHRLLGLGYGVAAALLVRRGVPPLTAGLATGAAAFVLVDEATMSTVLPPPWAYPVESHVRGAVGHLVLGAVAGAVLGVWQRLDR